MASATQNVFDTPAYSCLQGSKRSASLSRFDHAEVLYLPPYSPDLNPIEKAWAKIKQHLRSVRARTQEELDQAITDAIALITPENAKAWFRVSMYAL